MKAEKGFTLLEIKIALAVFATLAAALMSASQYVLGKARGLRPGCLAPGWPTTTSANCNCKPRHRRRGKKPFT